MVGISEACNFLGWLFDDFVETLPRHDAIGNTCGTNRYKITDGMVVQRAWGPI